MGEVFKLIIRSARDSEKIEEIRGAVATRIQLEHLASDLWNRDFCTISGFELKVYLRYGDSGRWRCVDTLGGR